MSLGCPDDRVRIMINDNSDVLMAFPVDSLINADVDKVIKLFGTLRLDLALCPLDTLADSRPVDSHEFGNSTARQIDGQRPDSKVEFLRKAASEVSPGDIRNEDAVFMAFNAVRAVLNLDQSPAPVESAPGTGSTGLNIIGPVAPVTERTIIFMSLIRAGVDSEAVSPSES